MEAFVFVIGNWGWEGGLSGCFFGRKLYPSPLRNHRWGLFAGGSVGDCVTARFAFMCTFLLRFDALTS